MVVIVGAGVSGLTLGVLLHRAGVPCVVLERRSRSYVEQRQRAGVLEHRAAQVYLDAGLGSLLDGVSADGVLEFRVDGVPRLFDLPPHAGGSRGRQLAQQLLVRRLVEAFVAAGGDLRFETPVTTVDSASGTVTLESGERIAGAFVAGCDGFRGVSRALLPPGATTVYTAEHGMASLSVLADAAPPAHPLFGVSEHGYAAQFARGPHASRFYLQCPPGDPLAAWPDERIWEQLRLRLADPSLTGTITDRETVDDRSVVTEPMSVERLYLVGDAAHIIPVMGGKGMNLAIADAGTLARALVAHFRDGDETGLRGYSAECVRRVWDYQEFSRWMSEMLFHAGDPATAGEFARKLARARLDRLSTSEPALRFFAALSVGTGT